MIKKKQLTEHSFPDDFLWGASTAGHQVEGGNYDQWTVYELDNAQELAKTAADRLRWLPEWTKIKDNAEDPENYVSGKGVDHLRRYKEDFRIIKKLNLNAFRFSIEWSRVEPDQGVWDKKAIDHYHNYISELKKQGIEPVVTLWHWTHPVWFENLGGFARGGNIMLFLRFVEKIAEEFGQDIRYVLTLNEPNVYASFSYLSGEWPPQEKNILKFASSYYNLARAHRQAYGLLKGMHPHLQVGLAYQINQVLPKRPEHWMDKLAAKAKRYYWNWWFLNRVRHHQDFIGINFYFTEYYEGQRMVNPPNPHSEMGSYLDPSALGEVIMQVWLRFHKPVLVTENGLADSTDQQRKWWLEESMHAIHTALRAGADVIGYLHWSLLDNFEWKYGWWPKFGLIKIDRTRDMKRLVRPSAIWWARELGKIRHLEK